MESSRKVKRAVGKKTDSTPMNRTLPSESLSDIFNTLHQSIYPDSKSSNNKPQGIWIAMSPSDKERDSALDNIGQELRNTFNINVLNENEAILNNKYLLHSLETIIEKHLNKSKNSEPNINLFLTAHGAPSWFFAPYKNYHETSCGLMYITKPLDDTQKDFLIHNLSSSYFIFSHQNLYFFNKETNQFIEAKISSSTTNFDNNYFFNQLKNIFSKVNFEDLTQKHEPITSLDYLTYQKINQLFESPPNFLESKFNMDSFVIDECVHAAKLAKIFCKVEKKCNIKFNSVVLFSCNSASEFINHHSLEGSLSSARVLSTFFKNRFIMGNIGKNSNGKTTGLFQKNDKNYVAVTPKIEKTLVIYLNQNIYYQPKDEFYLKNNAYAGYCYLNFFQNNNDSYTKYSYVLEEMMNMYNVTHSSMQNGGYGMASLQLQIIEELLAKLTKTNKSSNQITVI